MTKGKLVAACFVWVILVAIGAAAWKLIFKPARQQAQEAVQAEELAAREAARREQLELAGSESRYKHTVNLHLDSFSGYAVLRSEPFGEELRNAGIRLNLVDDGADYTARLAALKSGEAQMAAFTIDALIKTSSKMNDLPATIVALIDETTGADAIVAYTEKIPNVDALNAAEMKFVLTPDSPSETLARVVMSRFDLTKLGTDPFVSVNDAEEVFKRYKNSKPTDPVAYVMWEPYVSQMLTNPATHVVVDSSRFPSTIVDVIVAGRDFLLKQPDVVREVVKAYMTSVYQYRERERMLSLVIADAQATGSPLTPEQAAKLVDGIWWKNTQENLAHMGLLPDKPLPHVEDMVANLIGILKSTGGIDRDPTDGKANYWFYSKVFEDLRDFHPGSKSETVRDIRLPALSESQWSELTSIGTAKVPPLVFARGTDRLTSRAQVVLDELAANLNSTRFYVSIVGNASKQGNLEQNQRLAESRAEVARTYLIDKGVDQNRIRAVGSEPSGTTSVTFKLGQLPY
ncbi:MAG: phosphate ABC transporter substrate-binding/OmpA family protein [Pirellulaceae bacterium]